MQDLELQGNREIRSSGIPRAKKQGSSVVYLKGRPHARSRRHATLQTGLCSMASKHSYPVHQLDSCKLMLSDNPLDDYQRSYFASLSRCGANQADQAADSVAAAAAQLLKSAQEDLHIIKSRYRTSAVQSFHDVQGDVGARAHERLPKKHNALECSEYQLPDVLRSQGRQVAAATTFSGAVAAASSDANGAAPRRNSAPHDARLCSSLALGPGTLLDTTAARASPDHDLNCLTKNQQFRLRKMQYSDQRQNAHSQVINPNNCVLWDHQTGYVFFTGIWRLYQDVMHGLIALDRSADASPTADPLPAADRKAHCQKELDYVVARCFYEKALDVTSPECINRRKLAGRRGYRQHSQSGASGAGAAGSAAASAAGVSAAGGSSGSSGPTVPSAVHYSDVHWHNLDAELKARLCNIYRRKHQFFEEFEFQDLMKRIRGGYIKIQGTWLPYEVSRELCLRFCYPIRYFLVPIFGHDFPQDCANWYEHFVALYQRKTLVQPSSTDASQMLFAGSNQRAAPAPLFSSSRPAKKPKVDVELLDASKNLLDISRRLSVQEPIMRSHFSQVPMPQFTRNRSQSWAPEYRESGHSNAEMLPPIKPLLESLEFSLYPSPPNTTTSYSEMSSPIKDQRMGPVSPHTCVGSSALPRTPQIFGGSEDPHFIMVHSPSYVHESKPNPAPFSNIAYFYNSHGHRYSYPGGMQVMYHPSMKANEEQQQHDSRPSGYQVGVNP